MNGDNVAYFDSLKAGFFSKEIKKFMGNKNITANVYRIQANDSITHYTFVLDY